MVIEQVMSGSSPFSDKVCRLPLHNNSMNRWKALHFMVQGPFAYLRIQQCIGCLTSVANRQ
jgi:hypothetical protein